MLSDISPDAQQRIARAVSESLFVQDKFILCHTPAVLEPVENCILGTFERWMTVLKPRSISFSYYPPGLIQRIAGQHECNVFTFEAVFSVSASAGSIEACVESSRVRNNVQRPKYKTGERLPCQVHL